MTTGDHFTKLFCHCITRTSLHPVSKDIFLPSFELSPAVSSQLVVFLLTVVQGNFGFLYHASQNYFSLHLLPDSKTAFTCLGIWQKHSLPDISICFSFIFLNNNHHQHNSLKQNYIYCLTISMTVWTWLNWVFYFRVSQVCNQGVSRDHSFTWDCKFSSKIIWLLAEL